MFSFALSNIIGASSEVILPITALYASKVGDSRDPARRKPRPDSTLFRTLFRRQLKA